MGKLTPNQIREQVRNEVARMYTREVNDLKDNNKHLRQSVADLKKQVNILNNENIELKDEIDRLRDWNTRLQEYCNMTDEDREKAVEASRAKVSAEIELASHPLLQLFRHINF